MCIHALACLRPMNPRVGPPVRKVQPCRAEGNYSRIYSSAPLSLFRLALLLVLLPPSRPPCSLVLIISLIILANPSECDFYLIISS